MEIREIVTIALVTLGIVFAAVSVIGTLKQKDFLCYLQIAGIGSGAGIILCSLGLLVYEGFNFVSVKILFVGLMLMVTGPVGTHAIAKAAFRSEDFQKQPDGCATGERKEN